MFIIGVHFLTIIIKGSLKNIPPSLVVNLWSVNNKFVLCSAQTRKPGRILLPSWGLARPPAELTHSRNIMAKISFHSSVILSVEGLTRHPFSLKWRLSQRRKGRMLGATLEPLHLAHRWERTVCPQTLGWRQSKVVKVASFLWQEGKKSNKLSNKY